MHQTNIYFYFVIFQGYSLNIFTISSVCFSIFTSNSQLISVLPTYCQITVSAINLIVLRLHAPCHVNRFPLDKLLFFHSLSALVYIRQLWPGDVSTELVTEIITLHTFAFKLYQYLTLQYTLQCPA